MSDTKGHPACEHHQMAAARHVAAAYHHFQAVTAHDSCNQEQAQRHAATADAESAASPKCSMTAGEHSHKSAVQPA